MLFADEFCCKCDAVDEQYIGVPNEGNKVENVDKSHRVLRSTKSKLILMQSWNFRGKSKGVSDKPNVVEVVICRKHTSNEILHALQIGIRHFSGQHSTLPKKELLPHDFKSSPCTCIHFSELNRKRLAPSPISDFEWNDYSPNVFRNLQELGNVKYADYMLSVCGHETLTEISSPGKSGSLFYKSKDDRFVIKTLRKSEVKVLCEMLPDYLKHVRRYKSSLLVMLYGLHSVRPVGGQKVYFVVMANVLQSDVPMHRFYDLKGSSQGRTIGKVEERVGAIFKDLDLDFQFFLKPSTRRQLLVQIKSDCKFLESRGVMDYSLLLGLHIVAPNKGVNDVSAHESLRKCDDSKWDFADKFRTIGRAGAKFGVRMPARVVRLHRNAKDGIAPNQITCLEERRNAFVQIGIIDILQDYNVKKRFEHAFKSVQYDSRSISAVNPKVYSARFQDFVSKHRRPSDSSLKKEIAASLIQHHRSVERNSRALQPVSPASCNSSMEVTTFNPPLSPHSFLGLEGKIGTSDFNLKTSKELVIVLNRIWSLEEQHASNISLVNSMKSELDQCHMRIKMLLREKNKEQERTKATIKSTRDELEDERKLRKQSESLHRKLARELSDIKTSFADTLKEYERERNARSLLEDLCDGFARGIRDYEQEVRHLKQKPDKDLMNRDSPNRLILHLSEAWLDERIQMKQGDAKGMIVDNLSAEIETFLRAKAAKLSVKGDKLSSKRPNGRSLRMHSFESFRLNEATSAPRNTKKDDCSASSDSDYIQSQSKSSVLKKVGSHKKQGNFEGEDNLQVKSNLVLDKSITHHLRSLDEETLGEDYKVPKATSKWARGLMKSTLKAKLLEARLEGQHPHSKAFEGSA